MDSSAQVSRSRPFYSRHADLYDLLVTDPVGPWVDAVLARVLQPLTSVELLDAGCGTGRHAAAFVDRGCTVTLADASEELLSIASRRCPDSTALLVDLCAMPAPPHYDLIGCRGVLNDLVADSERQAALHHLAQALRPGGWLVCDLREAVTSQARADGRPVVKRVELPTGGQLAFTNTTRCSDGLLLISEEHVLQVGRDVERSVNQFVMRPWTAGEIAHRFAQAGLEEITIGAGVGRTTPDRLTVYARRHG